MRVPAICSRLHNGDVAHPLVVVCWDVEPDSRTPERGAADRWMSFERLVPRVEELRDRIADLTGAPASFSWFLRMDPQVAEACGSPSWVAERYADELAALESYGDQLGCIRTSGAGKAGAARGCATTIQPGRGTVSTSPCRRSRRRSVGPAERTAVATGPCRRTRCAGSAPRASPSISQSNPTRPPR